MGAADVLVLRYYFSGLPCTPTKKDIRVQCSASVRNDTKEEVQNGTSCPKPSCSMQATKGNRVPEGPRTKSDTIWVIHCIAEPNFYALYKR